MFDKCSTIGWPLFHNIYLLRKFICLKSILFFSLIVPAAHAGVIEGVILSPKGPVPGSTLKAYKDYNSLATGSGGKLSKPGEKEGQFRIELPPGSYYLFAEGSSDGRQMFSYHGINPMVVTDDYLWLPIFLVNAHDPQCRPDNSQGIEGKVTYKGTPLEGGVVSVYRQQDGKFRGMGLLTNTLDETAGFRFDLEPGNYVLIARRKSNDRGIGPVMKGDLFCYSSANPIQVSSAKFCNVEVECYPRDDLKSFLDDDGINPQGRRHDTRRNASLTDIKPEGILVPSSGNPAVISGTVVDRTGTPVSNMIVTAYPADGLNVFQMHILRLISRYMARTDMSGNFRIELNKGGTYYLVARDRIGEAPGRHEKYGLYEGTTNHSIMINAGEKRSGIKILISPIMPDSGLTSKLSNR